jgi:hypothetical protein
MRFETIMECLGWAGFGASLAIVAALTISAILEAMS